MGKAAPQRLRTEQAAGQKMALFTPQHGWGRAGLRGGH